MKTKIIPAALPQAKLGLLTALLLGVSAPASAQSFYNMACRDDERDWTLAMSVTGDHVVQLWRDNHPKVRVGTFQQNGDDVVARLEDMTLHLHVEWGNASWVAGDAKGILQCRFVNYDKPDRWQEARRATRPSTRPPDEDIPGEPLDLGPPPAAAPAPSQPAGGALCDFEHHCYGADGAPHGGADHVPIRVDDGQAFVAVHIGRLTFQSLLDTGATSMSLPETAADELIGSGDATEGEPVNVTHAGGERLQRRSIIVHAVTIGGHTVREVRCVVEDDGSVPLLGFGVLQQISPRFAINTTTSTLDF